MARQPILKLHCYHISYQLVYKNELSKNSRFSFIRHFRQWYYYTRKNARNATFALCWFCPLFFLTHFIVFTKFSHSFLYLLHIHTFHEIMELAVSRVVALWLGLLSFIFSLGSLFSCQYFRHSPMVCETFARKKFKWKSHKKISQGTALVVHPPGMNKWQSIT